MKIPPLNSSDILTALDIGSTKVACCIGRLRTNHTLEILGMGYYASRGMKAGVVVDMEALSQSIGHAIHAAEGQARESVKGAFINISTPRVKTTIQQGSLELSDYPITSEDVQRVQQHLLSLTGKEEILLNTLPISYAVDGVSGIRDPVGMSGHRLDAFLYNVYVSRSLMRNVIACVERCHLDVYGTTYGPYASALVSLTQEERESGAIMIDMGGMTTSLALFHQGQLVYSSIIPLGGHHITNDIAQVFSTSFHHAERIKTLYGSALYAPNDQREMIDIPQTGSIPLQISRAALIAVVQARLEEILEYVQAKIQESGLSDYLGRQIVLCGGGAQLNGMQEKLQLILGRNVRVVTPLNIQEIEVPHPPLPILIGSIGILYEAYTSLANIQHALKRSSQTLSILTRIGMWLKENI